MRYLAGERPALSGRTRTGETGRMAEQILRLSRCRKRVLKSAEIRENRMGVEKNYRDLLQILKKKERLAVAFSSGVDSTFLLYAAYEALGKQVLALTAVSEFFPGREREEASAFCREHGIRQLVVEFSPLTLEKVSQNPKDRCYLCKRAMFERLIALSKEQGYDTVAEGSNLDDQNDYRPGMRAIRELGVMSPLEEAGLYKADIRRLSKGFGLPTWDKPSFACLASRFAYGESITAEKLGMVEQAEDFLLREGFSQFRVRVVQPAAGGSPSARIEILPDEFSLLMEKDVKRRVAEKLHSLGFSYVSMDLDGYRMGSMNEDHGK